MLQHVWVSMPSSPSSPWHVVDGGARDASTTVLLLHGFPDFWITWRHQIPVLGANYHLLIPDLRGCGKSKATKSIEDYCTKTITEDLIHLLDHFDVSKVVVIGHGLGAQLAYRLCLYHPTRVIAVCGLGTPYHPPSSMYISVDAEIMLAPEIAYLHDAQEADKLNRLFFKAPKALLNQLFGGQFAVERRKSYFLASEKDHTTKTNGASSFMTPSELQLYVDQFATTGFDGPCKYFATRKLDFQQEQALMATRKRTIDHPVLFITGDCDAYIRQALIPNMRLFMTRLQEHLLPGTGHWMHWEKREHVNEMLLQWLKQVTNKMPTTKSIRVSQHNHGSTQVHSRL